MPNTITAVLPKLLAQGLLALRANTIMPRLVNRSYEALAAQLGDTINIPIPSAITVQDVTPGATPPATADIAPTSATILLNKWKEAPFYLTDKEMLEVMEGTISMQASEAIKSLGNQMDADVFATYKGVYGYSGTAGTTPFASSTTDYTVSRTILNVQLAPLTDRRVVLDPNAEGNALNLTPFQNAQYGGGAGVILEGSIGHKLGADWFMDQNTPLHTTGTLSNGTTHSALVNGTVAAGATTMNIDSTTLTGTLVPGDIFTVANVAGTFVVTNSTTLTAAANAIAGVTFQPPAPVGGFVDNAVVTVMGTHRVNLHFHRDAFAFASRPLATITHPSVISQAIVDPVSGVALRLEVTHEHKRTRFSYDVLYGTSLIRAELATRIAG